MQNTGIPASLINSSLLERLKKEGTLKSFPADAVIIDEHEYIRNVPIVISGSIKVLKLDEEGHEMLLYYIQPGESCVMSFLGAVCHGTSKIRAIVDEPSEVLILPIHKAIELIRDFPSWLEFIFQLYNRRFEELLSVINAIAFTKVDERLLLFLQTKVKMNQMNELNITHQQIADELGTAREVVSRLLKQLEKAGKVSLGRNRIVVHTAP